MSVWAVATSTIQERLQSRFAVPITAAKPTRSNGGRRFVAGAPEIYFHKTIDNTCVACHVLSRDGKKMVWRANYPQTPEAASRYKALLAQHLTGHQ